MIFLGILQFFLVSSKIIPNTNSKEKSTNNDSPSKKWSTLSNQPTKIIGHRGEKVLMPEHTVGSYEIACIEGAQFVEPDLVMTKDFQLVCYHDLSLKDGTDIEDHPELEYLKKNFTGLIGQKNVTFIDDWLIPDLTLQQIKMLKVKQKVIGIRPQYFNQVFEVATFHEYLEVVHKMSKKLNVSVGVIPEMKHPDFTNAYLGLKPNFMEDQTLSILSEYGYPIYNSSSECFTNSKEPIPCGHLILQSFDRNALEYVSSKTNIELMMLVDDDPSLLTRNSIQEISQFAHYYSVWKEHLYTGPESVLKHNGVEYDIEAINEKGGFISPKDISSLVHGYGMELGIYTLYDSREPSQRGCAVSCEKENKTEELFHYFNLGVDAMFVENIKEALEIRLKYEYIKSGSLGMRMMGPVFLLIFTQLAIVIRKLFL